MKDIISLNMPALEKHSHNANTQKTNAILRLNLRLLQQQLLPSSLAPVSPTVVLLLVIEKCNCAVVQDKCV